MNYLGLYLVDKKFIFILGNIRFNSHKAPAKKKVTKMSDDEEKVEEKEPDTTEIDEACRGKNPFIFYRKYNV